MDDIRDFTPGGLDNSPESEASRGVIQELALRLQDRSLNPHEVVQNIFTSCAAMMLVNGGASVQGLHMLVEGVADDVVAALRPGPEEQKLN